MVGEALVNLRPHTDLEILSSGRSIQSSSAKDFRLTKLKFEKEQRNDTHCYDRLCPAMLYKIHVSYFGMYLYEDLAISNACL
jgi:hypothetical protein